MGMLIKRYLYKEGGGGGVVVKYFYLGFQVGPTCYISPISIRIIAKVNLNFSNYCIIIACTARLIIIISILRANAQS